MNLGRREVERYLVAPLAGDVQLEDHLAVGLAFGRREVDATVREVRDLEIRRLARNERAATATALGRFIDGTDDDFVVFADPKI